MGNSRTQTTKGLAPPPIRRFPEFIARGPVDHATEPHRDPIRTGTDSGQIGVDLGKTGIREEGKRKKEHVYICRRKLVGPCGNASAASYRCGPIAPHLDITAARH